MTLEKSMGLFEMKNIGFKELKKMKENYQKASNSDEKLYHFHQMISLVEVLQSLNIIDRCEAENIWKQIKCPSN